MMNAINTEIEQLALQEYSWSEDSHITALDPWIIEDFVDLFAEQGLADSQLDDSLIH